MFNRTRVAACQKLRASTTWSSLFYHNSTLSPVNVNSIPDAEEDEDHEHSTETSELFATEVSPFFGLL